MMMKGRWKVKGLSLHNEVENEVVGLLEGVDEGENDEGVVNHS